MPVTFVWIVCAQRSQLPSRKRSFGYIAALFTSRSTPPKLDSASRKSRSTSSGDETSPTTTCMPPSHAAAVSRSASSRRPMPTTRAPSRASPIAIARPMPDPAPVTTAVLPSKPTPPPRIRRSTVGSSCSPASASATRRAFAAIVRLGFVPLLDGKNDASTTQRFSTPWARLSRSSTAASGSSPKRQVPTRVPEVVVLAAGQRDRAREAEPLRERVAEQVVALVKLVRVAILEAHAVRALVIEAHAVLGVGQVLDDRAEHDRVAEVERADARRDAEHERRRELRPEARAPVDDALQVGEHRAGRDRDADGLEVSELASLGGIEIVHRQRLREAGVGAAAPRSDRDRVAGVDHQIAADEPGAVREAVRPVLVRRAQQQDRGHQRARSEEHPVALDREALPVPLAPDALHPLAVRLEAEHLGAREERGPVLREGGREADAAGVALAAADAEDPTAAAAVRQELAPDVDPVRMEAALLEERLDPLVPARSGAGAPEAGWAGPGGADRGFRGPGRAPRRARSTARARRSRPARPPAARPRGPRESTRPGGSRSGRSARASRRRGSSIPRCRSRAARRTTSPRARCDRRGDGASGRGAGASADPPPGRRGRHSRWRRPAGGGAPSR